MQKDVARTDSSLALTDSSLASAYFSLAFIAFSQYLDKSSSNRWTEGLAPNTSEGVALNPIPPILPCPSGPKIYAMTSCDQFEEIPWWHVIATPGSEPVMQEMSDNVNMIFYEKYLNYGKYYLIYGCNIN